MKNKNSVIGETNKTFNRSRRFSTSRRKFLIKGAKLAAALVAIPHQLLGKTADAVPYLFGTRGKVDDQKLKPEIAKGPFEGTRKSLEAYQAPEWFRDAKFGIWCHWGPQSAAEYGDWYARNMYIQGSRQYKYHLEQYGHPSVFGFKDIIATWKADKFDPDYLMDLFRKAGAKYFMTMGVHHDNFDLWNSKYQPRWNSLASGPKKDIVGMFREAALKQGMRFGLSQHLQIAWNWWLVSHGADKTGPYAGVPYDGTNPEYEDLYFENHELLADPPWGRVAENANSAPVWWQERWFLRIKDLIDKYPPDIFYTDGMIPFEEWGLSIVAHLYNQSAKRHDGRIEAVFLSKEPKDCQTGTCVLDLERRIMEGIYDKPWEMGTCIGSWHYDKTIFEEKRYKSPKTIIDMLVEVVSRNGNLLLNFPLPNSGEPDAEELKILAEITEWMAVNGEGIYGTRPWKTFGEGSDIDTSGKSSSLREGDKKQLTAGDIRFTTKGKYLYAFCMGWPEKQWSIKLLALKNSDMGKIRKVTMLGFSGKLKWVQDENGLQVVVPPEKPCKHSIALKITRAR